MSSVVISGDTSGAITLAAPAVSGTNTITLPALTGTVALTSTNGAWTSYTPTVTAQTGTLTTVSATGYYQTIGKTCIVSMSITITNAGTGSGGLYATLPLTSANRVQIGGYGMENNSTGNMLKGYVVSSGTQLQITTYNNSSTIGSGYNPVLTIIYETA
jgi:hypothetical protein